MGARWGIGHPQAWGIPPAVSHRDRTGGPASCQQRARVSVRQGGSTLVAQIRRRFHSGELPRGIHPAGEAFLRGPGGPSRGSPFERSCLVGVARLRPGCDHGGEWPSPLEAVERRGIDLASRPPRVPRVALCPKRRPSPRRLLRRPAERRRRRTSHVGGPIPVHRRYAPAGRLDEFLTSRPVSLSPTCCRPA